MPITFGSVGDIIAVCVLVKDCVEALSDANGSASQYQAVIRELYILEKALLEVGVLSRTHATTPELTALFTSADTTIEQCRKSLAHFKAKIQPYENHLGTTSTNSNVQKAFNGSAKKLLWQIKMKDEVARFRAEVVAYSVSIDQILAAATMHSVKAQADRIDSRVEDLQRDSQRSFNSQDEMLKEIRSRLDVADQRISAGSNLIIKLANTARKAWFLQLGNELKVLMFRTMALNLVIFASVDKVHNSILELRRALPTSSLVTPLSHQRIFYLEDAIGRVSTITLDFITSYDALTAVLQVRFQGIPGSKKVLKKEYALQNRTTGKDVDASQRFEGVFLPGLWYNMSMVFQIVQSDDAGDSKQDACPRCGTKSNQPQGLKIKCSVCKQEYQYDRTKESLTDNAESAQSPAYTHAPEAPDSLVNKPKGIIDTAASSLPLLGPPVPGNDVDPDDDPANFHHVRIETRKKHSDSLQETEPSSPQESGESEESDWDIEIVEGDYQERIDARSRSNDRKSRYSVPSYFSSSKRVPVRGDEYYYESTYSQKMYEPSKRNNRHLYDDHNYYTPKYESQEHTHYGAYEYVPEYSHERTRPSRRLSIKAGASAKARVQSDEPREIENQASGATYTKDESSKAEKGPVRKAAKATEEDARRVGIPTGYSYHTWDPNEEPILLLGSVFDANSLGKWIYDWAVYHHKKQSPTAESAGELWLLLIMLAGKIKRAEERAPRIRTKENAEMIEDFLESGERLWIRFAKILKDCENYMWRNAERNSKGVRAFGKAAGNHFLTSMFGRDWELERTEKLMAGIRLWNMRFDTHCEDILKNPSQ